jgi:RNA-dependent RNA polymerase
VSPQKVDKVRIRDIIRFFVTYIANDNLGSIANSHLAQADMSDKGAIDGKCIRLAHLHSDAVGRHIYIKCLC